MKKLMIFLLISLGQYVSSAQILNTDSLKRTLKTSTSDSLKILLLNSISENFKATSLDSTKFYLEKAQNIPFCDNCTIPKAQTLMQLSLLKAHLKDSSFTKEAEQAIELFKQAGNTEKYTKAAGSYATELLKFDQIEEGKKWLWRTLATAKRYNYFQSAASAHSNLGYLAAQNALYDSAAIHLRTSLEYKVRAGEKESQRVLLNIGVIYFQSGNTEMALPYYKKALNRAIEEKDQNIEAVCYQNIGALYTKTKQYDKSLASLSKANKIYQEKNDSSSMSTYYASIADIFLQQKQKNKALENYLMAKDIFPVTGRKARKLFVHLNLSRIYIELSELKNTEFLQKAINEGLVAYQLSVEGLNTANELEVAALLFKAYNALEQFKEANKYAAVAIELRDSLYNKQRVDAVAEVQEKYETEKRELEIELLSKDNSLKQKGLLAEKEARSAQKRILIAVILGLIISSVLITLLFIQTRKRQKANALLMLNNKTISKQNNEKELLLKEIHHRVKNNLQVVSSLLELQSKSGNESEKGVLKEGQSRVRAMALIHEKLYQNDNIAEIDLEDYCHQLCRQIASIFPDKGAVKCQIEVPPVQLDIDTAVPLGLILNELITNAYKYAFPAGEGQLNISVIKTENQYLLSVQDSGPGLADGFEWKKSKSLGLRLINRLARQLYGNVQYSKDIGKSKFEITFKDTIERKKIA